MNKKDKLKKVNLKKVVAGTLATTIFLESTALNYSVYFADSSIDEINKKYMNLNQEYPFTVLNIPISVEAKNYLDFVNYLLVDILTDTTSATRFLENPNFYVQEAGFEPMALNMEEDGLFQMILNLADTEIREAILNNDISEFLRLCKEKDVFKSIAPKDAPPFDIDIIKLPPDIKEIINPIMGEAAVAVVVAAVAVVVAYFTAVAAATVFVAATKVKVLGISNISLAPSHEFVLQLWGFHGGDPSQTYVITSEIQEQQINSIIEALQQNFPEKLEGVNIDNIKQFLALNIQKCTE